MLVPSQTTQLHMYDYTVFVQFQYYASTKSNHTIMLVQLYDVCTIPVLC